MKKNLLLTVFIFLLIVVGCTSKKDGNDSAQIPITKNCDALPHFDLTELTQASVVKLSELGINDIKYIPLETDTSNLISGIKKIETDNNSFYIGDWFKISKYALDGKYIKDIGVRGRGPKEYHIIMDFTIDSKNNYLFMLNGSRVNGKIFVYTLNGDFIKSFSSPAYAMNLACMEDRLLYYLPNIDGTLDTSFILASLDGETEKVYPNKFPYNKVNIPRGFLVEFLCYKYGNQLYTKEIYSDTIFAFKNLNFEPAYILNHGEKTLSPEVRGGINSMESHIKVFKNQIHTVTNQFETQSFIYSEFIDKEQLYTFIGFKDRDAYLLIKDKGIINDIDGGPSLYFKMVKDKNTLISWINAYELKDYVRSEDFKNFIPKYPEKKKELEKLANRLDENNNPVLMLVKLKQ